MADWMHDGRSPRNGEEFSPMRKFQLVESAVQRLLIPAQEIDPSTYRSLDEPAILIVGNQNLRPDQLALRGVDFQTIGSLNYPGKSALLDFMNLGSRKVSITPEEKDIITQRTVAKRADRHDGIWAANLYDILDANFKLFYAPVNTNGLHLRIVYKPHMDLQYPLFQAPETPNHALEDLRKVWRKLEVESK